MKQNHKRPWQTALFLVLAVACQFLAPVSRYLSDSLSLGLMLLAALHCGLVYGGLLGLVLPLTGWWFHGAAPLAALGEIPANFLLLLLVWLLAKWLPRRMPAPRRLTFSDPRFRQVLLLALAAAVLWAGLCLVFLHNLDRLSETLGGAISGALPAVVLAAVSGCFFLFACLWLLAARFSNGWTLVAGVALGAAARALALWGLAGLLPHAGLRGQALETAQDAYTLTPFLTSLFGGLLGGLSWTALKPKSKGKQ